MHVHVDLADRVETSMMSKIDSDTLATYLFQQFLVDLDEVPVSQVAKHFATNAAKVNRVAQDKASWLDVDCCETYVPSSSDYRYDREVPALRLNRNYLRRKMIALLTKS